MIDYIVMFSTWIIGGIFILSAGISFFGGLYTLTVDGDGLLIAIFATIGLAFVGSMSINVGNAAYHEIQEIKAHPCIQWGNDYEHGKLGQVCIKRKP